MLSMISDVTVIVNGIFSEEKGHTWQKISTSVGGI